MVEKNEYTLQYAHEQLLNTQNNLKEKGIDSYIKDSSHNSEVAIINNDPNATVGLYVRNENNHESQSIEFEGIGFDDGYYMKTSYTSVRGDKLITEENEHMMTNPKDYLPIIEENIIINEQEIKDYEVKNKNSKQNYDKQFENTIDTLGLTKNEKNQINKAYQVASLLHEGQTRKGQDTPYIEHPLSNMARLVNDYRVSDVDLLNAALLHDVLEDSKSNKDNLEKYKKTIPYNKNIELEDYLKTNFGKRVLDAVEAVSNPEIQIPRLSKNENYANHVRETVKNPDAFIIKFADFADNAGTLKDAEFDDPNRKPKLAKKYEPLPHIMADALSMHQNTLQQSGVNTDKIMNDIKNIAQDLEDINYPDGLKVPLSKLLEQDTHVDINNPLTKKEEKISKDFINWMEPVVSGKNEGKAKLEVIKNSINPELSNAIEENYVALAKSSKAQENLKNITKPQPKAKNTEIELDF